MKRTHISTCLVGWLGSTPSPPGWQLPPDCKRRQNSEALSNTIDTHLFGGGETSKVTSFSFATQVLDSTFSFSSQFCCRCCDYVLLFISVAILSLFFAFNIVYNQLVDLYVWNMHAIWNIIRLYEGKHISNTTTKRGKKGASETG